MYLKWKASAISFIVQSNHEKYVCKVCLKDGRGVTICETLSSRMSRGESMAAEVAIRKICPCNVYPPPPPHTLLLYGKTVFYRGIPIVLIFLSKTSGRPVTFGVKNIGQVQKYRFFEARNIG